MIIGQRIDALIRERGLTQSELARRVGVSQPTIFGLIHHNKTGSVHLHRVARELHTTAAYLAGETDDPESEMPSDSLLSSEEADWVDLLRSIPPKDRSAALQLVRTIAHSALTPTTHAPQQPFKVG